MRRASKVNLQPQQRLPLPRKMNLMIDPRHILKRHLQCAEQAQSASNLTIAVSLLIAGYSFERKRAMRATPPPKKKMCLAMRCFKCDALNNQTCKLHLMFSCDVSDV